MMNRNEDIKLDFFMSQIKHLKDIKETEKTKLSIVLYEATNTTCILRICKGRNLSSACDALLQVKNPNTALVYQYVYAGGNTYILEEMLSGKTLEEIICTNGVFSEKDTAKIIISICSGLENLHKMQPPIIHNDINTSNIMLCDDNRVKLFDFDISRTYKKDSNKNTELFGTEEYASPEHYGYGQSEPRTDIYSLGVTIHRMLTGKYLSKDRKSQYKGRMKKLINKCIEIDPKKRYSTVQHLEKDLEKVLDFKKTVIKIVAFLCVIAVLFTGLFFVFNNSQNDEKPTKSNNETITQTQPSTESTNELIPHTTTDANNTQTEKLMVSERLDGELLSMVATNNDEMIYLEKISDEYRIKSSSGTEVLIPDGFATDECELLHNPYNDSLYIVTTNSDEGKIYTLSTSLELSKTPVYTNKQSYTSDIKGMLFSDGTMYCNAFNKNLIDTNNWSDKGSANCSPIAAVNDRIYDINNNFYMLDELTLEGNCINQYEIPGETLLSRSYFSDKENFYLTVTLDKKSYVYAFNGELFSEIICFNDYKNYTDFKTSDMVVTKNKLWLYDKEANAIKEFTI